MGRSYSVPRNVKGESRFLYIFSVRSFLTTIGGVFIGWILYYLFAIIGLKVVGFVLIIVFGLIRIWFRYFNNT